MAAFDFKKVFKELYLPGTTPSIIDVPEIPFLLVSGTGDPNTPDGSYKHAVGLLYGLAYTLKMSHLTGYAIPGYFPYTVPPLEGFWWQDGCTDLDLTRKDTMNWRSVIRLPDFVTPDIFDWAVKEATFKKKMDFSCVEYVRICEGLTVQCMHIGPFDTEQETIAKLHACASEKGYHPDFTSQRLHHEIYLSDPRRCDPSKLKTVIRLPIA